MAIYHLSIKVHSRSKGSSSVSKSAYRSGEKLTNEKTGEVHDYTRKSGIVYNEVMLPDNAPIEFKDRENLWNAVEEIEKSKNSQLCREYEGALPKELSIEEHIKIVQDFAKKRVNEGMCVDFSIHDKGDGNPHFHMLCTMRSIDENGKFMAKSKNEKVLDKNGEPILLGKDKTGRKKYKYKKVDVNNWNRNENVEIWRKEFADISNKYLSKENQIDHRSYERQGIKKIPTIHEGYKARQIEKDGNISERCQENREIRKSNNELRLVIKKQEEKKYQALEIYKQNQPVKEEEFDIKAHALKMTNELGGYLAARYNYTFATDYNIHELKNGVSHEFRDKLEKLDGYKAKYDDFTRQIDRKRDDFKKLGLLDIKNINTLKTQIKGLEDDRKKCVEDMAEISRPHYAGLSQDYMKVNEFTHKSGYDTTIRVFEDKANIEQKKEFAFKQLKQYDIAKQHESKFLELAKLIPEKYRERMRKVLNDVVQEFKGKMPVRTAEAIRLAKQNLIERIPRSQQEKAKILEQQRLRQDKSFSRDR